MNLLRFVFFLSCSMEFDIYFMISLSFGENREIFIEKKKAKRRGRSIVRRRNRHLKT